MRGGAAHKKANLKNKSRKKNEKNNGIKKIDQNYHNVVYKIGEKWRVFEGYPSHPPIFVEVRTSPKLILHTLLRLMMPSAIEQKLGWSGSLLNRTINFKVA